MTLRKSSVLRISFTLLPVFGMMLINQPSQVLGTHSVCSDVWKLSLPTGLWRIFCDWWKDNIKLHSCTKSLLAESVNKLEELISRKCWFIYCSFLAWRESAEVVAKYRWELTGNHGKSYDLRNTEENILIDKMVTICDPLINGLGQFCN